MTSKEPPKGAYRIKLRRTHGLVVKPEHERLDGQVFEFRVGWQMESDDRRYPHEWAMLPERGSGFPVDDHSPTWIASGDLELVKP
jgi:hypothetical protein